MISKQQLRQQCLQRRQALPPHQVAADSQRIAQHLDDTLNKRYPNTSLDILCYQATPQEVQTASIFFAHAQHHYYAPVTEQSGVMQWLRVHPNTIWNEGALHISEPQSGTPWQANVRPTILLCPLVGFDQQGQRIGMGKGCFDRWLEHQQVHIQQRIGLAFSCQRCTAIPHEPHDIPLHAIITEEGWHSCPNT